MRRIRPLAERFWEKVDKDGPEHPELGQCWIWTASRVNGGYGSIGTPPGSRQRAFRAHRVAWELVVGKIPEGLFVLHDCDNPACVRPAHLSLGTQAENMRQMFARKRRPTVMSTGFVLSNSKLTPDQVRAIRAEYAAGARQIPLGKKYGVSQVQISNIVRGKQWRSLLDEDGAKASRSDQVAPPQ